MPKRRDSPARPGIGPEVVHATPRRVRLRLPQDLLTDSQQTGIAKVLSHHGKVLHHRFNAPCRSLVIEHDGTRAREELCHLVAAAEPASASPPMESHAGDGPAGSDNDPTTVATLVVVGASSVYSLSSMVLLLYPMLAGVLLIAARVGLASRSGLLLTVRRRYGRGWGLLLLISVLSVNLITLAASIASAPWMYSGCSETGGNTVALTTAPQSGWARTAAKTYAANRAMEYLSAR